MQGIRWIALVLALAGIALGVSVEMRVRSLEGKLVPQLIAKIGTPMQKLHDSWRSNHVTKEVTTERNAGETVADFTKRHNDVVKAQLQEFPADNT
jgi:broad specificity phosphatase PhoE